MILIFATVAQSGGVCGFTESKQLETPHNRAARILTGSNYDNHSKPLMKDQGWKTIEDLIQYELQIIVFKSRNGLAHQSLYKRLLLTRLILRISYETLNRPKAAKENFLQWAERFFLQRHENVE